jgi:hypothetical protein
MACESEDSILLLKCVSAIVFIRDDYNWAEAMPRAIFTYASKKHTFHNTTTTTSHNYSCRVKSGALLADDFARVTLHDPPLRFHLNNVGQ